MLLDARLADLSFMRLAGLSAQCTKQASQHGQAPNIESLYGQLKYFAGDDLYGGGTSA